MTRWRDEALNMPNDWWQSRKDELLAVASQESPVYVYNEETLNEIFFGLLWIRPLIVKVKFVDPLHERPCPLLAT
jgi:hypothetical protein